MSSHLASTTLPHRGNADGGSKQLSASKGSTALTSKITTILSTSYSDAEFRDALALLDERGVINDPETRRQLKLDLQKEVIDSNSTVIAEFGRVAEVGLLWKMGYSCPTNDTISASSPH